MSVSTLPEIRPLSGAASILGPESELAARFIEYASSISDNAILAPEVPVRDGVADLLKLQFRHAVRPGDLSESKRLARVQGRSLFTLAAFRPNQRYTLGHLRRTNLSWPAITELVEIGLIHADGDSFVRPTQLVDRIESVVSYEFKVTNNSAGLRQAALRRTAVTRSYLVTVGSPVGTFPDPDEFRRLGVGWISYGDRPIRRIGAERSQSPRWARLLMLRTIHRGLERHIPSDSLVSP